TSFSVFSTLSNLASCCPSIIDFSSISLTASMSYRAPMEGYGIARSCIIIELETCRAERTGDDPRIPTDRSSLLGKHDDFACGGKRGREYNRLRPGVSCVCSFTPFFDGSAGANFVPRTATSNHRAWRVYKRRSSQFSARVSSRLCRSRG